MNLFSQDSSLVRALNLFADLVIVNLTMIVFSLPVVTAGAAISAGCRITRQLMNGEGSHLIRSFWKVFLENWKQATVVWIADLVAIAALSYNFKFFKILADAGNQQYAMILLVVLLFLLFLLVGISIYLFFMISRYENTLKGHIKNSVAVFFLYAPRSIVMMVLNALPFGLFLLSPYLFIETSVIWVAFGFAAILYVDNLMLRPVFRRLENQESKGSE